MIIVMKRKILLYSFWILTIIVGLSSCVSKKQIVYFQKGTNQSDTIDIAKTYVPKIQPGDILSIYVTSLNSAASSFFNPFTSAPTGTETGATGAGAGVQPNTSGFLVDPNGDIEIPLVGDLKVAGLTTSQMRDTIKERLKKGAFLKEPTVNVRFLNYKISIIGEVTRPSEYAITNERISLPEALSLAGDLTVFAKRDNILIVRDNNGKKEFGRVNLNSRDVFTSPYYHLHSGDLIYVEPTKGKYLQTDPVLRILPIVLSSIAIAVTVFVRLK